jgi:hypothetical protein
MSRTRALWISAILTLTIVLVAGTMLFRPTISQPSLARTQPEAIAAGDAGAEQLATPVYQVAEDYQSDDHDQYEHHESHEEHEDDD